MCGVFIRQNNWGNFIGILTTVSSGGIDYLFGNHSAVITYPLTFFIHTFALVYLGAYLFGGRTDSQFLNLVSLVFGLSLGANFCNALKYEETWLSWVVYNVIQLVKNAVQMNLANVAKYIFYMLNAFVTLLDWKWNGDVKK